MSTSLYTLGRWCFRHYRRVIVLWVALLIALGTAAALFNNGTRNEFEIPGTESQEAINALARTFPEVSGTSAMVVIAAPKSGSGREQIDTPQTRALVSTAVTELEDLDGVSSALSPFDEDNPIGLAKDGQAARIWVQYDKPPEDITHADVTHLEATTKPLTKAGYATAWGGDMFSSTGPQLSIIELIGVAIAFIVLYLMFKSLRAAVMPIVTAVVGVIVSMSLIVLSTNLATVSSTTPLLALMIGLAVGIDYALFIVSRHREQLADGVPADESAGRSVATAGSAVVFAGVTVVIALVGLAIARIPFLTVMGVAAAVGVIIAVIVALTLLPALLGRAGDRLRPKTDTPPGAYSRRWVLAMIRFPKSAIVAVVLILLVMTLPAFDLRLALPDNGSAPHGSSQREAYDLVGEHFGPGYNGPLLLTADIISTTDPIAVVKDIEADLKAMPDVEAIGLATPNPTADTAVWQVIPSSGPVDQATRDLVNEIRGTAAAKWSKEYGVDVKVTGLTAGGIDVSDRLEAALVPFGIVVVGLSVLLLMIVFRTIVVPLKATLGFLLSTGASLGAVVAVFQWGWLGAAVNLDQPGPLMSFLPIMLIAVLFGLSMDYEVFLMSRMKEEYVQFGDPRRAIVDGFVGSSRVVTAAAIIMLAVFAAFVPEGDPGVRPIAFALAVGVAIDAFLIRMLFAPAVLEIFGKSSWKLPKKLDAVMPHIDVEGEALHRQVELESWPEPNSTAAVTAAGLTSAASEGPIYKDVWLSLRRGDWLIVHGPSGTGKTSLLLTLAGRMPFDEGRLRVAGYLLPQEARLARRQVSIAEFGQINELEDNLTVDQHIAERLSIARFGLWVSRRRIAPIRDRFNDALSAAWRNAGVTYEPISGSRLISTLSPLERLTFSAALALIDDPTILVIDDADIVRSTESLHVLWATLAELLEDTEISLIASVQSPSAAPEPTDRVQLLELNTPRTLSELMI